MRSKRILVRVSNDGWDEDSAEYSITLAGKGQHKGFFIADGICDSFTKVTGIKLPIGTSKVFRLALMPQRKKATAR